MHVWLPTLAIIVIITITKYLDTTATRNPKPNTCISTWTGSCYPCYHHEYSIARTHAVKHTNQKQFQMADCLLLIIGCVSIKLRTQMSTVHELKMHDCLARGLWSWLPFLALKPQFRINIESRLNPAFVLFKSLNFSLGVIRTSV